MAPRVLDFYFPFQILDLMLKGSPYLLGCDAMPFVKAEGMNNFYFFQLDADGIFFLFSHIRFDLEFSQVSGLKMFIWKKKEWSVPIALIRGCLYCGCGILVG